MYTGVMLTRSGWLMLAALASLKAKVDFLN